MGHLKRVDDKKYRIVYDIQSGDESRKQKTETLSNVTKKQAEAVLAKREAMVAEGQYVRDDDLTLEELVERFMHRKRNSVAPKTLERYAQLYALYLNPRFGRTKVRSLRQPDLLEAYSSWSNEGSGGRPLSGRSVRHVHDLLRNILNWGVRMEVLQRNVASLLTTEDLPRAIKPDPRALDEGEVERLLAEAQNPTRLAKKRGTLGSQPWFHPAIVFSVFTGARRGETLALRWSDVDLEGKVATIRRSLSDVKSGLLFKEPKNGKTREINLPEPLVEVLKNHRMTQAEERRAMGAAYQDNDLVFALPTGTPIKPSWYGDAVKDLVQRTDLPQICLHDLRDTHASLLAKRGVPLEVVSKRLGHSNISITADRYLHVYQSQDVAAASVLNDLCV